MIGYDSSRTNYFTPLLDTRYPKMLKKSIILCVYSSPQEGEGSAPVGREEKLEGDIHLASHASAIKRAKQNERRRLRNLYIKTLVKSSIKKVRTAVEKKDVEEAQKALQKTIPLIQKARSKGVFHKNTSARKISRLTREVNALKTPPKRRIGHFCFA